MYKSLFRNVAGSSILLIVLILAGKFSGLLKDILITSNFGVSEETDAFFLATYISTLIYIGLYSSISIVLIPKTQAVLRRRSPAIELYSLFITYIIFSIFISFFTYQFSIDIVKLISSSANIISKTENYLKLMALTFPLSTLVGILNSFQLCKGKTIFSYVTPVVNNLIFCTAIFIFSNSNFVFILYLSIMSWVLICILNIYEQNVRIKKILKRFCRVRLRTIKPIAIGVVTLFVIVEQFTNFIPIYFISMGEPGELSEYTYANKLNMFVLSVSLLLITSHVLPRLSISNGMEDIQGKVANALNFLCFFMFPLIIIASINSEEIVEIIFFRGNFSFENVLNVKTIFSLLVLVLPAFIFKDILNRAFFVLNKNTACIVITLFVAASNLIIDYFLYVEYGVLSIVITFVSLTYFQCILLYIVLFKFNNLNFTKLSRVTLIRLFAVSTSVFLLSFYDLGLFVYTFIFLITYLLITYLFDDCLLLRLYNKLKR